MNLYELSTRFQQLLDQDELSEADCAELDSIYTDATEKCISRAKYIRNKKAELVAVEAARKEMQEREKKLAEKIECQENWLLDRMVDLKLTNIDTPEFPIKVKENPVSVNDYDKTVIPERFWVVKVSETKSIDKNAIKSAIQSGEEVPGASLLHKLRIAFK
jgi:hypothetical protein